MKKSKAKVAKRNKSSRRSEQDDEDDNGVPRVLLARLSSRISSAMVARASKASAKDDRKCFLIDSGASKHMCCEESMF